MTETIRRRLSKAAAGAWAGLTGRLFLNLPDRYLSQAAADLDDASLVKWARWSLACVSKNYENDAERRGMNVAEVTTMHGVISLALMVLKANASEGQFSTHGITYRGEPVGDWRVTIARLTPPASDPTP
jgi:hypothetical protein